MRHPVLELILVALAAGCATKEEGTGCFPVEDSGVACPPYTEVSPEELDEPYDCDNEVVKVVGDGEGVPVSAYYDGSLGLLLRGGEQGLLCWGVHRGPPVPGAGRGRRHRRPLRGSLGPGGRGGARIRRAFARLQLQLLAHGAPLELVRQVADALRDEVRHTELALSFTAVALGPLPLQQPVDPKVSLAELAAEAVRDGCVGETLSALLTRAAADQAPSEAERQALLAIADDEDRHAALSWALVAWAIDAGGADVEAAVREAFASPHPRPGFPLLDDEARHEVLDEGMARVIRPAVGVLLAA